MSVAEKQTQSLALINEKIKHQLLVESKASGMLHHYLIFNWTVITQHSEQAFGNLNEMLC